MNITQREGGGEGGGGSLVIGIQLMLNKNYPQLTYENIQVMCSLTGLSEVTGEVKTRPTGAFTNQTKILTWRCGNQSAGKQPLLQMEAIVPLQQMPSPLPTSLPLIVKAFINDTTILPDCAFEIDTVAAMTRDGNPSLTMKVSPSGVAAVGYKSKIEYRFL
jgi:hypothetical protein